jgi:hypothetical protein
MYKVFRYAVDGREYADLSTNISDRGVFIKSFSPPSVGTQVTIFVKGPEGQSIRLLGRVAHVNLDPDPHKRGMGIEFTAVQAESPEIIKKFVEEIFAGSPPPQEHIARTPEQEKGLSFEYRIIKKKGG